ncbi:hypothetical protein [uncultured Kordia sp.]|uniref:hypothetical protein n=1 Tax=uncultured Kordia sp. TaxID=507699 RepID=UPI00261A4BB9|nr:hypothetical protein [uncultured Kordia sp.]
MKTTNFFSIFFGLLIISFFFSCNKEESQTTEEDSITENKFTTSIWTQEYLDEMGWDSPENYSDNEIPIASEKQVCPTPCYDTNYTYTCDVMAVDGYISRFYDSRYGAHFLLAQINTNGMVSDIHLEHTWRAPLKNYPNAIRVFFYSYQYSNNYGAKLLTTNPCELGDLINRSWKCWGMQQSCASNPWFQWGIAGYLCGTPTYYNGVNYNIPIYRKRNVSTGKYLYTQNPNEANGSYVLEGLIGYAG